MDPEVSKRKFGRDVESVKAFAADFCWTVRAAEYPTLDVVVTHPRSGRKYGFRFTCDNWDSEPLSFTMFDAESGQELPWEKWPHSGWNVHESHPITKRPF